MQLEASVGLYLNLILFHGVLISVLAPWEYLLVAVLGICRESSLVDIGFEALCGSGRHSMSLLEVHDLVVRFGQGFQVGPASFAMDRGILHMQGSNGGGKTTLMKAMSGALCPHIRPRVGIRPRRAPTRARPPTHCLPVGDSRASRLPIRHRSLSIRRVPAPRAGLER